MHGQINTEEARAIAKQHLGGITTGEDPAAKKKENKSLPLMKDLVRDYLERHAATQKKPKSIVEDTRFSTKIILPALGNQHVKTISRRTIESLHLQLAKTPIQANRVLSLLSKMFTLAVTWGWRDDHPVKGINRYAESKRYQWLNDEEMQRLSTVLNGYRNQNVSNMIRLLLLTGSRSHEVFRATWDQFDLEKGVWTKSTHTTKQKKMEHLPLSSQALALLKEMEKTANSKYLFPGKVPGNPITNMNKAWKTICKQSGIADIRIHDLRHTHASHLVSSGLSLSIVGKLLGHTQASTTQRYAHLADEPLRQAAEVFGSKLEKLTSQEASQ